MEIPDNTILDVILSLALIYALLSVLVSLINETWTHYVNIRGKYLKKSIGELINDSQNLNYAELLFNNDIINRLIKTNTKWWYGVGNFKRTNLPGYISSNQFADAFIDIIIQQALRDTPININSNADGTIRLTQPVTSLPQSLPGLFDVALQKMNGSKMKDMLTSFHLKSMGGAADNPATIPGGYYEKMKKLISEWFDDYMNQSSGDYKVKQRPRLMLIGLIVAVSLNVDSLHLAKKIFNEPELRESLVNNAMLFGDALEHQSDSARNTLVGQLEVMREYHAKVDSTLKATKKIQSSTDTIKSDSTIKAMLNELNKDTTQLARAVRSMVNQLNIADSMKNSYSTAIHMEIGRLPIGYRSDEAPLSWRSNDDDDDDDCDKHNASCENKSCDSNKNCCEHKENRKTEQPLASALTPTSIDDPTHARIMEYYAKRNAGEGCSKFLYFLGIVLTAISLSLGAPFWFEALIKLVNIRRGAVKPKS